MTGTHYIRINGPKYSYDLALERKISILRGEGGTGKSTLINLINEMRKTNKQIINKGITPINILDGMSFNAVIGVLSSVHDEIMIADEEFEWFENKDFCRAVNTSNNYFLFITRKTMKGIGYSVNSIYELNTDENNVHTLKKIYNSKDYMSVMPDKLICEDSKSGYILFKLLDTENNKVETAKGNRNLYKRAKEACENGEKVAIFGDGSAFGFSIEQCMSLSETQGLSMFLPESFEFLLLQSEIFEKDEEVQQIIKYPLNYIDSNYSSGEVFFTHVLTEALKRMGLIYSKKTLFRCFIDKCCPRYRTCNSKIEDSSDDKIKDIVDKIPINLSKIFIDGRLNQYYIEANKDNKLYYEVPPIDNE